MTRFSISRTVTLLVLATAGVSAQAHPGHSLSEAGMTHTLTSPYHLAILTGGGALMFASAQLARQSVSQRLLRQGGAVALLGAAVLWSLSA